MLPSVRVLDIVDIAIVAFVSYKLLVLIRGTRAEQLIKGLVVLLLATVVSGWLGLYTVNWILRNLRMALFIAVPIVFQPELRRALEQLGRGKLFAGPVAMPEEPDMGKVIREVVSAADVLVKGRIGCLVVLERTTGLNEYAETGVRIDGLVSAEFLVTLFAPNMPLHDGAVIIRGDRVVAAACVLPLSENPDLGTEFGMRHRAALGITEISDAVAVVVSEQAGAVSVATAGKLTRYLDARTLREMLNSLYQSRRAGFLSVFTRR